MHRLVLAAEGVFCYCFSILLFFTGFLKHNWIKSIPTDRILPIDHFAVLFLKFELFILQFLSSFVQNIGENFDFSLYFGLELEKCQT